MLILVAGITGFVGIPVAEAALKRGYQVRGLARNRDRLPKGLLERLESFETLTGPHDIAALERAVAGVDAVVSTIAATPETIMETQVLLLKAAEWAGVKIFHASTWNLDWRQSPGTHEVYDSLAHFAHHASMTSTIKPIYMFTGAIAEWYFVRSAKDWDRETKTVIYHGDPAFKTRYTTANDIANYVLEAITAPDAAEGGYIRVQSFEASPDDVVEAYNAAREGKAKANHKRLGSVEDAKVKLDEGRAKYTKAEWWNYAWYIYQYHIPLRTWDYEPVDVARFSNVKQTSLEEFFRQNPDV
ncbi:unnamed protein product [Clonostachys rhizophaga]|uniref:NmrA-like domain-containing protein n=1 Tax=Clonostachys rhizophaga TaxID=160324 RepID=A0A9N9VFE0_9HYPO|nr:unnamed protein product [Clonostachys rhizophaga]